MCSSDLPVQDRRGRVVAHGDLGHPRWKVLVEYEGRQHAEQDQFGRDVDRCSLMAADGWLVLRLAQRHLRRSTVLDRLARAYRSRGARWCPAEWAVAAADTVGRAAYGDSNCPLGRGRDQAVASAPAAGSGSAVWSTSMPASTRWASEIGVGAPVSGS